MGPQKKRKSRIEILPERPPIPSKKQRIQKRKGRGREKVVRGDLRCPGRVHFFNHSEENLKRGARRGKKKWTKCVPREGRGGGPKESQRMHMSSNVSKVRGNPERGKKGVKRVWEKPEKKIEGEKNLRGPLKCKKTGTSRGEGEKHTQEGGVSKRATNNPRYYSWGPL